MTSAMPIGPANRTTASSRSGRALASSTSATSTARRSGSPAGTTPHVASLLPAGTIPQVASLLPAGIPLGRQQSQRRQCRLPQRDLGQLVLVALGVGLTQGRGDRERRAAQ